VTWVSDMCAKCDSLLGRCGAFERACLNYGAYNTGLGRMCAASFVSYFPEILNSSKSDDARASARKRFGPFHFHIPEDDTLSEIHVSACTGSHPAAGHQPGSGR